MTLSNVKGYAGTVKAIAEEKFELEESGASEAEVERAVHDMAKLMSEALGEGHELHLAAGDAERLRPH